MAKRWEIDRETTVREVPNPGGFEMFLGALFWIFIHTPRTLAQSPPPFLIRQERRYS